MIKKFHPFHMVTLSPWPIIGAMLAWDFTSIMAISFNYKMQFMFFLSLLIMLMISILWWKDVSRESTYQGFHQFMVEDGLKMGMILFIASEVLFFTSFFWSYFHSSISPNMEIGQSWPPILIKAFDPMNVPLLNTIILVSSGVSVTWAHHAILSNSMKEAIFSLTITCILGIYFTSLQAMEYIQAEFSIADSTYGSTFFMATGFHGIHVLIGTSFLLTSLYRLHYVNNPSTHIIGFELAAWYWHFVDIVWLFLYISIYWWGN